MPADPSGLSEAVHSAVERAAKFPRMRYMGSKYRLVRPLAEIFSELGGRTALDAFSGSGVVSYTLKSLGYAVTSNDFLNFAGAVARATVSNNKILLSDDEVRRITGPAVDDRDFIRRTFDGLYFDHDDREFLDSAWSHIDLLVGPKRDIAISALVLSAARKQPRGVFTVTNLRYDDGRRDLHLPLRDHFTQAVSAFNDVVFDRGTECGVSTSNVFDLPDAPYDLVYLDPPYAPPRDDNCYIKRYHFLEGLSVYWHDQVILENTKTKKLAKRFTPFSYKHSVTDALRKSFKKFRGSTIVLSYSSNAVPDRDAIEHLLGEFKDRVEVRSLAHRYSFGTHGTAQRREVSEYIFIGY